MPAAASWRETARSSQWAGSQAAASSPVLMGRSSTPASSRRHACYRQSARSAYNRRMRRRWRAKWPSAINAASTRCDGVAFAGKSAPARRQSIHQCIRQHQIRQPQSRKQQLAERAQINHPSPLIRSFQRAAAAAVAGIPHRNNRLQSPPHWRVRPRQQGQPPLRLNAMPSGA